MIFPILTFLTALSLAAVSGWFSITGLITILAGQKIAALILGSVLECGKLVSTSWLYRNWKTAGWALKVPLLYFTAVLMIITSIGVFGYLSKAHLEQGAPTLNNQAEIELINQQIQIEKQVIDDNKAVINQLDSIVNNAISTQSVTKSLAIRRSQQSQRAELSSQIVKQQEKISNLEKQKFKLSSELRNLDLEVGPLRYVSELIYGKQESQSLESAVKLFVLLIVTTLDPLAVVLLIAANHTLVTLKNRKNDSEVIIVTDTLPQVDKSENITESDLQTEEPAAIEDVNLQMDLGPAPEPKVHFNDDSVEEYPFSTIPEHHTNFEDINEQHRTDSSVNSKDIDDAEHQLSTNLYESSNEGLPNTEVISEFIESLPVEESLLADQVYRENTPWAAQSDIVDNIVGTESIKTGT